MEQQRKEEMEQMRVDEIQCGGFIPPIEEESSGPDASTISVNIDESVIFFCVHVICEYVCLL